MDKEIARLHLQPGDYGTRLFLCPVSYTHLDVYKRQQQTLPFSSAKKYGGVQFHSDEVYLLGAPDILLASQPDAADTLRQVEEFSAKGCRVLLLGLYEGGLNDDAPTAPLLPLSLVLLSNKIREAAPDTFAYFARQGVAVKVISGDNALTVSEVARRAGIEGAENYVDARTLQTEKQLAQAAERCTVFGLSLIHIYSS